MKISRKTINVVLAVIVAMLAFFKKEFGLSISPEAIGATLLAIVSYLQYEWKADRASIQAQANRFLDWRFWSSLAMAVLPVMLSVTGAGVDEKLPLAGAAGVAGVISFVKTNRK